ncbi:hypothetical protein BJV78DRAFT_514954 [Lactifluus subvellereus]|nr:hypothetical protein BJV78DRAFT_514954 [Lactifluus subvellereus]
MLFDRRFAAIERSCRTKLTIDVVTLVKTTGIQCLLARWLTRADGLLVWSLNKSNALCYFSGLVCRKPPFFCGTRWSRTQVERQRTTSISCLQCV